MRSTGRLWTVEFNFLRGRAGGEESGMAGRRGKKNADLLGGVADCFPGLVFPLSTMVLVLLDDGTCRRVEPTRSVVGKKQDVRVPRLL